VGRFPRTRRGEGDYGNFHLLWFGNTLELERFVNRWPAIIRRLRRLFRTQVCIGRDLRSTGPGGRRPSGLNCCSSSRVTSAPICRGLVHARCRPRMPIGSVSAGARRPRRARPTAGVREKRIFPVFVSNPAARTFCMLPVSSSIVILNLIAKVPFLCHKPKNTRILH
jgi:hypothetical protein